MCNFLLIDNGKAQDQSSPTPGGVASWYWPRFPHPQLGNSLLTAPGPQTLGCQRHWRNIKALKKMLLLLLCLHRELPTSLSGCESPYLIPGPQVKRKVGPLLQHWAWVAADIISHLRPRFLSLKNMHLREGHLGWGATGLSGVTWRRGPHTCDRGRASSCTSAPLGRAGSPCTRGQSEGRAGGRAPGGAESAAALSPCGEHESWTAPGAGWCGRRFCPPALEAWGSPGSRPLPDCSHKDGRRRPGSVHGFFPYSFNFLK